MFKLFRRDPPAPAPVNRKPVAAARRPAPTPARATELHEPPPVGHAVEDHAESAWDLWEQSQFQLDSQMGSLSASDSVRVRDNGRRHVEHADPFALVGKNGR